MGVYNVIVKQTKFPDYPCMTGYNITAPNSHDAEKEARNQFVQEWGFGYENTEAYIIDKHLTDYRNEHKLI